MGTSRSDFMVQVIYVILERLGQPSPTGILLGENLGKQAASCAKAAADELEADPKFHWALASSASDSLP